MLTYFFVRKKQQKIVIFTHAHAQTFLNGLHFIHSYFYINYNSNTPIYNVV